MGPISNRNTACCLVVYAAFFVTFLSYACTADRKDDVNAEASPPCPKVGHAIDLCPEVQVKLVAAQFFRAIGQSDLVRPPQDHVFALVELEWPKLGDQKGQVTLVDGLARTWPAHAKAAAAWQAMQPLTPAIQERDVRVFELPIQAATTGLFLQFSPPCETAVESPHFCLGKHQIVME